MAVKFSGNLTFTFLEYPNFVDRYRAAKNAGYKGVESSCPVDIPVEEVAKARRDADIQQVHINSYGGNIRGLAAIPNREEEFKQSLEISIKYAKALECPRMHVMAGLLPSEADRTDKELMAQWEATYIENMKYTAQRLEECGITALVEPITTIPGYFVTHTQQAIDLIKKVDHRNFQLQLDLFHHQRTNGNLTQTLTDVMPYLGYIQVSQVPCRDEPDSGGEINYPFIFQQIAKLGYTGWIGAEYSPRGSTLQVDKRSHKGMSTLPCSLLAGERKYCENKGVQKMV